MISIKKIILSHRLTSSYGWKLQAEGLDCDDNLADAKRANNRHSLLSGRSDLGCFFTCKCIFLKELKIDFFKGTLCLGTYFVSLGKHWSASEADQPCCPRRLDAMLP